MRRGTLERRAYNVAAVRAMARRRLPRAVFDFVDGGAEDEVTLRRNEASFAGYEFLPRALEGTVREQSVELFGERLSSPVIIAPTGLAGIEPPHPRPTRKNAVRAAVPRAFSPVKTMRKIA